jgi:hypothetical protein
MEDGKSPDRREPWASSPVVPDGPPRPEDRARDEDRPDRQRQWREKLQAEQGRKAAQQRGCRCCLVALSIVLAVLFVGVVWLQQAISNAMPQGPRAFDPQFRQASVDIILSPSSPVVTGHVTLSFQNLVSRPDAGLSLGLPEFSPSTGSALDSSAFSRDPLVRLAVRGPGMGSASPCVGPCEITLPTDSCPASWFTPPPGSEMCAFDFPFRVELAAESAGSDIAEVRVHLTAAASVPPGCSLPPDLAIELHLDQSPASPEAQQ